MNRQAISKPFATAFIAGIALLVCSGVSFSAETLSNGSFNNGLSHWDISTQGVKIAPDGFSTGNPAALLWGEGNPSSTLSQTFANTGGDLSFIVRTPVFGDSETDEFYVSLFDNSGNAMWISPAASGDYLFHWDRSFGWYFEESLLDDPLTPELEGITVIETPHFSIDDDSAPDFYDYSFLIPVSFPGCDELSLVFRLDNCYSQDDPETQIIIDNVSLTVPAPAALGLGIFGLALIRILRQRLI